MLKDIQSFKFQQFRPIWCQGVIQESPYPDEKPYQGDLVRHGQRRFIPIAASAQYPETLKP